MLFLPILFLCYVLSAQDCIDESQINPDAICPFIYAPVCGCDAVTYTNSCEADAAGVTQYVNGECGVAPPCADLNDVDFGLCLAVLGVGYQNGSCTLISGCGFIVNDVDYTSYFYETIEDCEAACGEAVVSCDDLSGVDFGDCDLPLGVCNINGTCTNLSGCDWIVDDVDYSPFFFDSIDDCNACLGDQDCEDLSDVDFGDCEMYMGIAFVNGACQDVSGCGFIVNDVDYSPFFFESMETCQANCDSCIDPGLIDPSALCNGDYQPVCGCDNITYWNACVAATQFGVSSFTEGACDCLNPDLPQDMVCFDLYDPVCGCDNVTYSNECYAFNGGVTAWTSGECDLNSVSENQKFELSVYPNPVNDILNLELTQTALYGIELFDHQGRLVYSQRTLLSRCEIDMSELSSGAFVLRVLSDQGEQVVRSIVK